MRWTALVSTRWGRVAAGATDEQRVLVTAGASWIGREIARAFAANEADVFVCDLNAARLDDRAKETPGLKTGVCDVSKRSDIERMVKEGVDALGSLAVLVNNAGISGLTAPSVKPDPAELAAV